LHRLFGDQFRIDGVNSLLKSKATMEALKRAGDPEDVSASWRTALAQFEAVRAKYLIYP
jgi:hypothetical protein